MSMYKIKNNKNECIYETESLAEAIKRCTPGTTIYDEKNEIIYDNPSMVELKDSDYKELWGRLKKIITAKAKSPTINSKMGVKHAEELARKQAYFDIVSEMDNIEQFCISRAQEIVSHNDDKYAL